MKVLRRDAVKTYKSLVAAAGDAFAEKGYKEATIAEICKRAGTNVASVNYHFGDKETLYRESWRYSLIESLKTHPPDGGVADDALPEERLRGRVMALLHRVADENSRDFLIANRELANPTGLLEEVLREELQPLHEKTEAVVRELLGLSASAMQVQFCVISIINQCINPMVVHRGRRGARQESKEGPPRIDDIEAYGDHVVRFSLAGLAAIRKRAEKPKRRHRPTSRM